jgi:hypothetical protein
MRVKSVCHKSNAVVDDEIKKPNSRLSRYFEVVS